MLPLAVSAVLALSVLALSSCAGPEISADRADADRAIVPAQPVADGADAPSNGSGAAADGTGAPAITRHEAEARVPLGPAGLCETPAGHCEMPNPHLYPDEYICDGGDRGYPVHYDAYNRLGLETSDAVAEFVDHTGKLQVRPTNRVCVYAPRFAAMRTLDTPAAETSAQGVASADRALRTGRLGNRIATDVSQQQTPAVGLQMRSRASGVDVPTVKGGYDQIAFAGQYARYRSGHQEISFLYTGRLKRAEEAWLASGVQAAAVWTRDQFPVVTGRTQGAEEVVHRFKAEEMIGTDAEGIGELRIVKLADRAEARPGDVITFTLRYDNLGDGPLHHIRVIDNLSPRLEYVEDSETSDRPGTLYLEDNQEGSLVLIFELDDPLPAKTGGVITFQARVR